MLNTFGQVLCNYPNSSVVPWLYKTPFLHKATGERDFYISQKLPLIDILGNVAYTLAAWAAAEELFVIRSHLSAVDLVIGCLVIIGVSFICKVLWVWLSWGAI
jgi:hypothetical protein